MTAGHGLPCFPLSIFLSQKKHFDRKNIHTRDEWLPNEHKSLQKQNCQIIHQLTEQSW